MTWLYFALAAPLFYAFVNLLDDHLLQNVYRGPAVGAAISGLFGILPVFGLALFGNAMVLPAQVSGLSVMAGFLTAVSFYYYFKGLDIASPSAVAALFSISPAVIPIAAYFVVGERLTPFELLGFSIIIVSAFVYTLLDTEKVVFSKVLVPVVLAAALLDIASVTNKYVYTKADFYPAYFYFWIGLFIGGVLFSLLLWRAGSSDDLKQIFRKNPVKILSFLILVEVINGVAEFFHDRALSLGPVSLVNALENLQPLYLVVIAVLLYPLFPSYLREAKSKHVVYKFGLAVMIVVGAYIAVR